MSQWVRWVGESITLRAPHTVKYNCMYEFTSICALREKEGGRGGRGEKKKNEKKKTESHPATCIAYVSVRAEKRREMQPQGRRSIS